ncbi:macrocin O-methyltransferase [Lentisphaera profundi]|uniref:Macrocin O-methyltransferase n=1 Tax=Lentisphaera profundi TaxID=1658616 RepID=A0ABY7VYL7_9BACT|nr:TylF/MycF/NovP-related O-methyltransferase [Lentisphaera profundi]WDE99197.1 macrocin O-methyltransferase [Lentisphaera profundi]
MKLAKSILKKFTPIFQNTSFFMQGQMDINPKSRWTNRDLQQETGGFYPKNSSVKRTINNLEAWDNTRRDMITLLLRTLIDRDIEGSMAELGVYKGNTSKLIHNYMPERPFHLFDTFEGFTDRSVSAEAGHTNFKTKGSKFSDTSMEKVREHIAPQNDNVQFHKGYFPDSLPADFPEQKFAFVHLDADLYEPTFEGLKYFYERMSKQGIILIHDYNAWIGARKAVDDFFADKPELPVPMPDKSGSVLITKQ